MLPRLSPSITIHVRANKRATAKYASSWPLTFGAKRVDYAPLRQLRNILKARIGVLNKCNPLLKGVKIYFVF